MKLQLVTRNGYRYLKAAPAEEFIQEEADAVTLVGYCGEQFAERLLLHSTNLSNRFFDLRSGLAGAVLQKFANYHMKVALVVSQDHFQDRFREFVLETNRGNQFRTFQTSQEAEHWLTSG